MHWCDYCGAETMRPCRRAQCKVARFLDGEGPDPDAPPNLTDRANAARELAADRADAQRDDDKDRDIQRGHAGGAA